MSKEFRANYEKHRTTHGVYTFGLMFALTKLFAPDTPALGNFCVSMGVASGAFFGDGIRFFLDDLFWSKMSRDSTTILEGMSATLLVAGLGSAVGGMVGSNVAVSLMERGETIRAVNMDTTIGASQNNQIKRVALGTISHFVADLITRGKLNEGLFGAFVQHAPYGGAGGGGLQALWNLVPAF